MSRSRKILVTVGLVGFLGALAGIATYSAFSSQAVSENVFAGGTVAIGANDSGSALYSLANQKPGDTVTNCIKVTYSGTLDADVKIFVPDTVGALGQYLDLTVTPGTQASSTFPSCTGFVADGAALFNGTLQSFQQAHDSWTSGISDYPGSSTKWQSGDAVVYRFTLTLQNTNSANAGASPGLTTGPHRFNFEARNQ